MSDLLPSTPDPLALAESHRYVANYETAFQILDDALQAEGLSPADLNLIRLRKLAYQIEHSWLYNRLAIDFDLLRTQLEVAQEEAYARHDIPQFAFALFSMARLHHFQLFEVAERNTQSVESRWVLAYNQYYDLDDQRGMAECLFYNGLLYQRFLADQDTAFTYFEQARGLLKDKSHPLELSEIMRHSGYVYQQRGDLVAACACHEQAVGLLEQIGFRVYLPLALIALGLALIEQELFEVAIFHFEKALAVAQEAPPNILHVGALMGLGDYYAKAADPARARDFYQRAQDAAQLLNSTRFITMASDKLAALP